MPSVILVVGSTALMGLTRGVHVLGLARPLHGTFRITAGAGCGGSIAYPSYSKIISGSFPEGLRGAANAAVDAGSKVVPLLGVLLGVELVNKLSWRGMFGHWRHQPAVADPRCFSLKTQAAAAEVAIKAPPYSEILRTRAFWGTVLGLFGANYT